MSTQAFTTGDGAASYYITEEEHHPEGGNTMLGFWIYLMSDCLLFAALFATYGVLAHSYAGGPSGREVFELPLVALNTAMLLFSSITYGFAMLAMERGSRSQTMMWMAVTWLFGAAFVGLELHEFAGLIAEGHGPWTSGFLTAFFGLVGTHGLHVTTGLIWMIVLMVQTAQRGLIPANKRRLMCLSMFWHFLDVVWIGVFTFVYLMGVL